MFTATYRPFTQNDKYEPADVAGGSQFRIILPELRMSVKVHPTVAAFSLDQSMGEIEGATPLTPEPR